VIRLIAVLFSNFLLLWITSFVDEGLITEQESKSLYQQMILISTLGSIIVAPLFGYISDKVSSAVLIPIAFTIRGACGYTFMFMNDPRSPFAITICCLLILFTVLEAISIEVLLFRGMPSQIRGTMMGAFSFFGMLGTLLFTLIGGQMFDRIGRNSPFVFLAIMDSFLVLLTLFMTCTGTFKSK